MHQVKLTASTHRRMPAVKNAFDQDSSQSSGGMTEGAMKARMGIMYR